MSRWWRVLVPVLTLALLAAACSDDGGSGVGDGGDGGDGDESGTLTVYSGRDEELVGPVIEQFEDATGINVEVRYGETAELAATILEEGGNSPADVFFAQDAGALGALADEGRLTEMPQRVGDLVPGEFRSPVGQWVGVSGRARTVVYNTEALSEGDLPESILDFTDPEWEGRIGWAPTNGSFQSFVTALRELRGEEAAREWLEGIDANGAQVYPKNTPIVQAVIDGEVEVGFVNHYYLLRFLAEDPAAPAANYFLPGGDPGSLVNVAGAGVIDTSNDQDLAVEFVEFLLTRESQEYFATETFEFPLVEGVEQADGLPPISELDQPEIDLSDLDDLQGTLELLQEVGLV